MPRPSLRSVLARCGLVALLSLPGSRPASAQASPAAPPPASPPAAPPASPPASPPAARLPPSPPSASAAPSAAPLAAGAALPTSPSAPGTAPPAVPAGLPAALAPADRCPVESLTRLHEAAPSFLVEVHARQGATAVTGVVIAPDRVVVPTNGVIHEGWPITVYFADGARSAARVRHYDWERELAVLVVESPPPGLAPPPMAAATPAIGAPLVTFGAPLRGASKVAWEVRQTTLSNVLDGTLMASPEPARGAPLLTCAGELVGVQGNVRLMGSGDWLRDLLMSPPPVATGASALREMNEGKPRKAPFGTFSLLGAPQLTLSVRGSEGGVGLKLRLLELGINPGFFFSSFLGTQWVAPPDDTAYAATTVASHWRPQMDLVAGYRLRPNIGSPSEGFGQFQVVPFGGVALRSEVLTLTRQGPGQTIRRETTREEHTDPLVGLSLGALRMNMSYTFQLDVKDPGRSIHTIGFGYGF